MSALSKLTERIGLTKSWSVPPIPTTNKAGISRILGQVKARIQYTPDAYEIFQNQMIPVFIYGTHMKDRYEYTKISSVTAVAEEPIAFTVDSFETYQKHLGKLSFPIGIELENRKETKEIPPWAVATTSRVTAPPAIVKGQLFFILPEGILDLDMRMRNGVWFERKKVPIQVLDVARMNQVLNDKITDNLNPYKIMAHMYVGVRDYWEPQLDAGFWFSPVKLVRPHTAALTGYSFFPEVTGEREEEKSLKLLRPKPQTTFETIHVETDEGTEVVTRSWVETTMEEYDPVSPASIKAFEEKPDKQSN